MLLDGKVAPEGGTEAQSIIEESGEGRGWRIFRFFATLAGTFLVLVCSAVVIDWFNRHDPRNSADDFRRDADQFRHEVLTQRVAFQVSANAQRSASRVLLDAMKWRVEDAELESDKQKLVLAFDEYQTSLDLIGSLLTDSIETFDLSAAPERPEDSQLRAYFQYQTLLLRSASRYAGCLTSRADSLLEKSREPVPAPVTATAAQVAPAQQSTPGSAAIAPPPLIGSPPLATLVSIRCAADRRGNSFILDEGALKALDSCETAFARELVDATRIVNRSAKQYNRDGEMLQFGHRLLMEWRDQLLGHGPVAGDWATANDKLVGECQDLGKIVGANGGRAAPAS